MSEIERYNGLTTADKGALMDAKARGAEWVARDKYKNGLFRYVEKPERSKIFDGIWKNADGDEKWKHVDDESLPFIRWDDPEPVNIDLAIAQIAEMESAEKSNECEYCAKLSQYAVWGYAEWFEQRAVDEVYEISVAVKFCPNCGKPTNSPYTEGEKE